MKASEIIRAGITEIEQRGWCQGSLRDEDGKVCLEGALVAAVGGVFLSPVKFSLSHHVGWLAFYSAFREANDVLALQAYRDYQAHSTADYNDRATTSQEDVLLLMKTVAEDLEGQGK